MPELIRVSVLGLVPRSMVGLVLEMVRGWALVSVKVFGREKLTVSIPGRVP